MLNQWQTVLRGQALAGLFLSALGIFILLEAISLDYTSDFGPGPGFLPLWLGIIITCLSLLLIFTTVRKNLTVEIISAGPSSKLTRSLVSWFAIMLSVALLAFLGFYASFGILTAFLVLTMERRSVFAALAVAIGSALGFYLIFSLALRAPLPSGPWGF